MIFILLLLIAIAVVIGLTLSGTGAALWGKKTTPGDSLDVADAPEKDSDGSDDAAAPDRTVAPDASGRYHREVR